MKGSEVCIKTRSPPASLPIQGQVTKHTTVKWPIALISEPNSTQPNNLKSLQTAVLPGILAFFISQ